MRFLVLLLCLFCLNFIGAQSLSFAFKGTVSNAELGKNESGVTVSIVQNGSAVGSATTATNGKYALKGNVNYKAPFSVVFSKAGMVSKKINFNFLLFHSVCSRYMSSSKYFCFLLWLSVAL